MSVATGKTGNSPTIDRADEQPSSASGGVHLERAVDGKKDFPQASNTPALDLNFISGESLPYDDDFQADTPVLSVFLNRCAK